MEGIHLNFKSPSFPREDKKEIETPCNLSTVNCQDALLPNIFSGLSHLAILLLWAPHTSLSTNGFSEIQASHCVRR